ncbi:tetratricopeptide repeat protein [bacterium]|nr:tetratricopeptide repeat protein [bacterium]NIN91964.1 tetratricopeptide repeat protein [bacterium]NIO18180.1 tetratricopeptide repeat protein [bacterium]NIO73154.1 tetratricopeptide repeat protein [bacterium]
MAIGLSVILAIWLIKSNLKRQIILPRTYLDKPLFIFFLVSLLSVAYSFYIHPNFKMAIISFGGRRLLFLLLNCLTIFYLTVYLLQDEKNLKRLIYIGFAVGTVASLYALLQYAGIEPIWPMKLDPFGTRSVSTFGNPNFMASFLMLILPLIAVLAVYEKVSLKKLFLGGLFGANFFGLLVTRTRSAWLGLFVALIFVIFYLLVYQRTLILRNKRWLLLLVALLFVVMLYPVRAGGERKVRMVKVAWDKVKSVTDFKQMAYVQRFLIWEAAYSMFKESPLLGHGWGNFEIIYPFHQGKFLKIEQYSPFRTHANNAHNEILEVVSQIGIVGLGIYIWFFILFFKLGIDNYRKLTGEYEKVVALALLGSILGMLVDNLLNVSLHFPMPALLFWVWMGLIVGICQRWNVSERRIPIKKFVVYPLGIILLGIVIFNIRYFRGEVHYFKGFKYAKNNATLARAAQECELSYKIYPLNVDNNYELGNAYARLGEKEKAIWAYLRAIDANPGYDEIYSNLGIMYGQTNRIPEAIEALIKSIEINPLSVPNRSYLAQVYIGKKEWEKASEQYREILELDPENAKAKTNLSYIQAQMKKKPPIPAATQEINLLFEKGEGYVKNRDWNRAEETYRKIVKLVPGSIKAHLYLGNIYFSQGKIKESINQYQKIIELSPTFNTGAHNNLGLAYLELKKVNLAREEFQKVLKADPGNELATRKLKEIESGFKEE